LDVMSRRRKDPLRALTEEEKRILLEISRAQSEPAGHVAHAKMVLAVAEGLTYQAAAMAAGRKSNDAVSKLITRFNKEGISALARRHGGGSAPTYGAEERQRILQEFHRQPDREADGTASWSLSTLRGALRQAPGGLAHVSTFTIWKVLHEAGITWQKDRTWCETGKVQRIRKSGVVEVQDIDAEPKKKVDRKGLHSRTVLGAGRAVP
jgi:transposase